VKLEVKSKRRLLAEMPLVVRVTRPPDAPAKVASAPLGKAVLVRPASLVQ
jgi:hypothetical protein